MELDHVEDDEVKGEEDDDVANDDVANDDVEEEEEEEDGDVEDDDVEDEDRSQDREPFAGKMPPAKTGDHTVCEPAQSKCTSNHQHVTRSIFNTEIYRKNAVPQLDPATLYRNLPEKCLATD